jgi:hypothetical protein
MTTTFVLVPGAGCTSAVWAPTVRELTLRGHRALAVVDLPGHGFGATLPVSYLGGQDPTALATEPSGMPGIGTAQDVEAVSAVVRRAADHGPVVLVTYVRPTDDSALPLAVQDLMIAEGDALTPENPFDVHSLASSHVASSCTRTCS